MFRKCIAWYLIFFALFSSAVVPSLKAACSPSAIFASSNRAKDVISIESILEKRVVGARLHDLGFTPVEVRDRLTELTDQQIHSLAARLEKTKIGQSGEGVLIGVLIIILVVAVMLPLFGIRVWR